MENFNLRREALTVKDTKTGEVSRIIPVGIAPENEQFRLIKYGIWAYFILLLFEGALRKWVLPGLATPLLIVRDPIAIWMLILAYRKGIFPDSVFVSGTIVITVISFFTTMLFAHGNVIIAIYGARIFLFHFPLIYLIGRVFTRSDVIKLGKATLWISIPMAILVMVQFYSPQHAWVNRGVGGDTDGAGFSGALGFFRSPATFSFTNGTHLFFGFASTYIFYFWFNIKEINKILLVLATIGLLIAIPFSISRSLFFHVVVTFLFSFGAILGKPKYIFSILAVVLTLASVMIFLSRNPMFQTATEAFSSRFESASKDEGGLKGTLGDRFLGGMITALKNSMDQPFFGKGLGLGTNVASKLLSGDRQFLVAEEEWGKTVGELGPLLGVSCILLRLWFCLQVSVSSFKRLKKGDLLPWLLLSFGLIVVPQGQTAQPTSLGFIVIIGGLMLAALSKKTTVIKYIKAPHTSETAMTDKDIKREATARLSSPSLSQPCL